MAKLPSEAPILFDVECDSSTIKKRKDGSYKLVMEDVDRVHWETDEAESEEGYYTAKKYADNYYGEEAGVSAYETFTLADGTKKKCKFTITDVKYNKKSNKLIYEITPKNNKQADKITGIESDTQTVIAASSSDGTRFRPGWMPDGERRNLNGEYLSNADLSNADLSNADLSFADLSDADLRGADLRNAGLRFADLIAADLSDADLREADLIGADLIAADLSFADLSDADLSGARNVITSKNPKSAKWDGTTCPDGSMNVDYQPCSGDQLTPLTPTAPDPLPGQSPVADPLADPF